MKSFKIFTAILLSILTLASLLSCTPDTPEDTSEAPYHTVTFDTAGGSALSPVKISHGSAFSAPTPPTREGYIFIRWLRGTEEWDFSYDTVTEDITLRAEWVDAGSVYERENVGDGVSVTAVKRYFTVMEIPSTIDGLPVVAISDEVFADTQATQTSKFIVAESVKSIGNGSFRDCKDIEIVINGSLTSIGEGAFKGCNKLRGITLGDSLETVSAQAFDSCTALRNVIIPDGVKLIDENAFSGCTSLSSLTLGSSVEKIADSAFVGCSALKTVKYNGTAEELEGITLEAGNDAFELAEKIYMKD